MADFIVNKFLVERGPVVDNKDGTFTVYYRVFYSDDITKQTTLYKGHTKYDGDQQALGQKINTLLTKLDNTALDTAREEIDAVLQYLSGT